MIEVKEIDAPTPLEVEWKPSVITPRNRRERRYYQQQVKRIKKKAIKRQKR